MKIQITYQKHDEELGERRGSITFSKIDDNATDEQIKKLADAIISLSDSMSISTFDVYKIYVEKLDRTVNR